MPKSIDSTLRSAIDSFVAELTDLINEAALETVQEALGGAAAPVRRGPGRPRKAKSARKKATKKRATKKAGKKAKRAPKNSVKRVRRSLEDINRTAEKVLAYIKANPGKGAAEISAKTKVSHKDLKKPIIMLLDAKKIRTKGQKRGTTYWAGGAKVSSKRGGK